MSEVRSPAAESFGKMVQGELTCAVCHEPALGAFELCCCHQLLCARCRKELREHEADSCPHCRAAGLHTQVAALARRLISSMPASCDRCGATMRCGELEAHAAKCVGDAAPAKLKEKRRRAQTTRRPWRP